MSTPLKYKTR